MTTARTVCRVCESSCGLLATVEGDRVTALKPDPDHPISKGYACRKGTKYHEIHHHSERVLKPRVRRATGLVETDWDEALAEIGGRLRAILAESGPEAIGVYLGNAAGGALGTVLGATAFTRGVGTTKTYSCLTLDNSEIYVVTEACLGNPLLTLVADYAGSDLLVLLGTDPLSSQPSQAQSNPGGVREIVDLAEQGRLIVVDPRTSATAKKASLHLRPRPGSDVFLLAWLVREAVGRCRDPLVPADQREGLAAAVGRFDRELTTAATGLAGPELDALRDRLLAAERPLVWGGLGLLLGPHGTLAYWLVLALQAVLGGLDRPGGWLLQRGAIDVPRLFARLGLPARDRAPRSRIGGFPAVLGTLASATLAADIVEPGPGRLRALIVVAGNPAVSLPDTRRATEALKALDLLVSIDLFVNETGALAHAVLPAADWLERDEVAVHNANQRRRPHLEHTRPVVTPRGEAREDWRILIDLTRAAGGRAFGSRAADLAVRAGLDPTTIARMALATYGRLRWSQLDGGGSIAPGDAIGAVRTAPDRPRLRLVVPEFVEALAAIVPEPAAFQLLTSVRPIATMNTWLHPAGGPAAVAHLHPDDLAGLGHPTRVRLRPVGEPADGLEIDVVADPGVLPGVVVLPFGRAEANANLLIGTGRLEAFTGQPISNGRAVEIAAVPSARPAS